MSIFAKPLNLGIRADAEDCEVCHDGFWPEEMVWIRVGAAHSKKPPEGPMLDQVRICRPCYDDNQQPDTLAEVLCAAA